MKFACNKSKQLCGDKKTELCHGSAEKSAALTSPTYPTRTTGGGASHDQSQIRNPVGPPFQVLGILSARSVNNSR